MTIEVAMLISIVSVAFSIFFGLKNSKHTDTVDIEQRVRENTTMDTKLDLLIQGNSDIKNDLRNIRDELREHDKKIVELDASVKSAHHRIDGIDERLNTRLG